MASRKAEILILSQPSIGAETLKALLETDYTVYFCSDRETAEGIIEAHTIDFAMIDLSEDTEGLLSFCADIKHSKEYHSIMIGVTHDAMNDAISEKAIRIGASYTLSKPLDPSFVKNIVNNLVYTYINDVKEDEERWTEHLERSSIVVETLNIGLIVLTEADEDYTIEYIGKRAASMLGYDPEKRPEELQDRLFGEFIAPDDREGFDQKLFGHTDPTTTTRFSTRLKNRNGSFTAFEICLRNVIVVRSKKQFSLVLRPEYTKEADLKPYREEIARYQFMARVDSLTGIYNRETFFEETEKLVSENPNKEYIVSVWDIDRFKAVNEMFGSRAGDGIIVQFAEFLKRNLDSAKCTYGRVESDHFITCCSAGLHRAAERRLKAIVNGEEKWHNLDYSVFMHVGMYKLEPGETDIEIACDRAYIALQAIKDSYVYRINYFTREMRDSLLVEQEIVKDSEEALKNREFFVMYQPIVDAKTREIVAAEALVRWRKPDGGFVSPGAFIPTFEKNGFVSRVDRYVWEEVCDFQARRIEAGKRTVPVSVNLSRMDFYNSELYEELNAVAKQYGLDGRHIKVEVTESAYMDQTLELMSTMNKFRGSGYQVLMDDFGSGFSSLNMLKDFEVDVLKIDMKFMDSIDTSERAGNILYSIIQMAKTIRMQIVAEGVETVNQFEMLKNMDCDCIQGYYFYKPLPAEEFEAKLDLDEKEMSADSLGAYSRLLYFGTDEQEADEIVRLLENGAELTVVKTSEEALKYLEQYFGNVSLALIDYDAVGADCDRFLEAVTGRRFYGHIPIMLIAKAETVDSIAHHIWEGVLDIVSRPYNTSVLKNRMEHAIEYYAVESERAELRMMGKGALLRQQMNSFFENSIAGIVRVTVDLSEELNILELSYVNDRFLTLHVLTLEEAQQKKTLSGLLSRIVYVGLFGVDRNVYTAIQNKDPFLLREYSVEQRDGSLCNIVSAFSFKYLSEMVQIDLILLENTSSLERRVIDIVDALSRYYEKDGEFDIWRYYIDNDVIDHYLKQPDGDYKRVLEYNASRNVLALAKANDTSEALKGAKEVYQALRDGAESLERDILVKHEVDGKLRDRWDRVTYFRKKDPRGDYAIGFMRDVTGEYRIHHLSWAHDRYMELMSDADVYIEADITDNRIINAEELNGILAPYGITESCGYDEMLRIFRNNIDENDHDRVLSLLSRKELLRQYRLGNTLLRTNFMGQTLRRPLWSWYEAMVLLGENPKTKHIEIGLKLTCIEQNRKEAERRIMEYDSLTGLYNRVMFEKTINRQLDDRIRSGLTQESAFILIDLDGFKRVNDVFGHDVGDSILKTIAKLITEELPEDAVTGRISGDEFVAFVPDAESREEICERLGQINEKTCYELNATSKTGEIIRITTSIGVVFTKDTTDRFVKLYPKADLALYQARDAGRNTYRVYENPL